MLMQNTEQYIKLLNECAENCKEKYCFFKTLAFEKHTDPRLLTQVKCVEIFKWDKSVQAHDDIGWKKAWDLWVLEGYAKAFEQAYLENINDITIRKVYMRTIEIVELSKANNSGVTNMQSVSDQANEPTQTSLINPLIPPSSL
jgi:hypothetical protein